MPTLLVIIFVSLAFAPRGGFRLSRAINRQQIIILILQRLHISPFLSFDDTSRLDMQVNRLQVGCFWMWLPDQKQRFFVISLMSNIPCFVPVEIGRLGGCKRA